MSRYDRQGLPRVLDAACGMSWLALLLTACSAQTTAEAREPTASVSAPLPQALPPSVSANRSAKPTSAFGDLRPISEPSVARRYAELQALRDPNNMMWAQRQTPPEHWRGLSTPLKRPYPGVPYSEVRAFTFGNDRAPSRNRGIALLDRKVPGCGGSAVAKDGTLCPSLNPPGKQLTPAQVERLVDVLEDGQPKRGRAPVVTMCLPVPTVLFVFFEAARPVAEMWLDPRCHFMGVHERARKLYPETYMAYGHEALRQLCGELSLVGSGCEPDDPELDAALEAQEACDGEDVTRLRWRRVPLGVPAELKTSELSLAQKERLCLNYARENPLGWGRGYECQDGYREYLLGPDTCLERFPACEATVGELVACQRHALADPCFGAPEAEHCLALRPCFFGTSSSPGHDPTDY